MQRSTVLFTFLLCVTVLLGVYKFGSNSGPVHQGILDDDNGKKDDAKKIQPLPPSPPPPPVPTKNINNSDKKTQKPQSPTADSSITDETSSNNPPPASPNSNNNNNNNAGSEGEVENFGEYLPAVPSNAAPISGCIDVSHEETANVAELTRRMIAFKPSATMHKKIWSDATPVFSVAGAPPPVMNQWLYCFTHNYSENPNAAENRNCLAELVDNAPNPILNGKYFLGKGNLERCTISPVFQGNITNWETLRPIYTQFPGPLKKEDRSLQSIAESRGWYWKNMRDPFTPSCPTCKETKNLVHPTFLLGARRWWAITSWTVLKKKITKSAPSSNNNNNKNNGDIPDFTTQIMDYKCFTILQNSFRTTKVAGNYGLCSGISEPEPNEVFKWSSDFDFSQIIDVAFAFVDGESFFSFTVFDAERESLETHLLTPILGEPGVEALWFSLQMFFGNGNENKKTRSLIFTGKNDEGNQNNKPPVLARNLTDHVIKLRCRVSRLSINYDRVVTSRAKMPADPFSSCWNDLISLSSFSSSQKIPVFEPKNIKYPSNNKNKGKNNKIDTPAPAAQPNSEDGEPMGKDDASLVEGKSATLRKNKLNLLEGGGGNDDDGAAANSKIISIDMEPTLQFPYLPCHPPYMTRLVAEARANNNMDSHGLYWPFSCSRISHRRPCLGDKLAQMIRLKSDNKQKFDEDSKSRQLLLKNKNALKMSELVKPKVAVCMAGFIRSFLLTSRSIFQNLVDPYNADFFAATWNVQGRVKKTDPVLKGHVLSTSRMHGRIFNAIPKDRNVTALIKSGRYGIYVFGYRMWEAYMKRILNGGFRHAGLYMVMAHSLKMAMARAETTQIPYDVVIRGRFDLVPIVPIMIYPVWNTPDVERRGHLGFNHNNNNVNGNEDENNAKKNSTNNNVQKGEKVPGWIIDTGSSCEMDGFWWPRTAVLREGVVVTHTADTRYKLFSWQYCDWLHIGTFNTMKNLALMYDWTLDNYVDSGAQFVEHIWAIDQGLRFYPMQLYLKILRETRKKPRKNGKKVLRIRMHLFG